MDNLQPHPEGGRYREFYRASQMVDTAAGPRSASTAIYFALAHGEVSRFHRLSHDEIWFWHEGGSALIHMIDAQGRLTTARCGKPPEGNYAVVIPAGGWFAAVPEGDYVLVSAVVAPGFDFADFELADQAALVQSYPEHEVLIRALTQ